MDKSPDAFRTIREVADWLGVAAHVLRFWESKFSQVRPVKRAGGRRYYRPADMELLGGIKVLLHDRGMTVRGVQRLLKDEGTAAVAALSPPIDGVAAAPELSEGIGDEDAWRADARSETAAHSPAAEVLPPPETDTPKAREDGIEDAETLSEPTPEEESPELPGFARETAMPDAQDIEEPKDDATAETPPSAKPPPPPAAEDAEPPETTPASMSRGLDAIWRFASERDPSGDDATLAPALEALRVLQARVATEIPEDTP